MASEIDPITPLGTTSSIGSIAAIAPITAPSTVTAIEVGVYSLNKFAVHKPCAQPALDYCHVLTGGFSGAMKHRGHNVAVVKRDKDVSPKQWNADTDTDPDGVGTLDFAYIASHGRTDGTGLKYDQKLGRTPWLYWFLTNCDSADGCWISTIKLEIGGGWWVPPDAGNPRAKLRLGDGRLRWVVLDCCRSLQIGDLNETDLKTKETLARAIPGETWYRCYDGVHMLFGFTGLSSDAGWTEERGLSFGLRAGRGEALAESWIDEAHSWILEGTDAPVVTAFGQSPAEVDQRLKAESLKKPGSSPTRPIRTIFYNSIWRS